MAVYTYDEEADALYVLLRPEEEAAIAETIELGPTLHVDLDPDGKVVGVEVLYPRGRDIDLGPVRDTFGLDLKVPFGFAAA